VACGAHRALPHTERQHVGHREPAGAIWLIGGFYLLTLVLGYGAAALVMPGTV